MTEYIDVEKLIEKCHPIIDVGMSMGNVGVTLEEIRAIPAADVRENVRGEWIECEEADYNWKCSRCNYGYTDYRLSYCYDCGADMRGAADE